MSTVRIVLVALILAAVLPGLLRADTGSVSASGFGVLFEAGILLVVLICFVVAMKIFSYLRGGELASGWQVLAISFIVLCLGQMMELASMLELFGLDRAVVLGIRLIGVSLLMIGVARIKKVLS